MGRQGVGLYRMGPGGGCFHGILRLPIFGSLFIGGQHLISVGPILVRLLLDGKERVFNFVALSSNGHILAINTQRTSQLKDIVTH